MKHVHATIIARVAHIAERQTSIKGFALSVIVSIEEVVNQHLRDSDNRQDHQQFDHALHQQEVVDDTGTVTQEYSVMVILFFFLFLLVEDLALSKSII